jgi:hypothetical protein
MTIGTLLKSKNGGIFLILEEIQILKKSSNGVSKKVQGYRVAPTTQTDWGFACTKGQILKRFEVIG